MAEKNQENVEDLKNQENAENLENQEKVEDQENQEDNWEQSAKSIHDEFVILISTVWVLYLTNQSSI